MNRIEEGEIIQKLQMFPIKTNEQLFKINNCMINVHCFYNLFKISEKIESSAIQSISEELNTLLIHENEMFFLDVKNIGIFKLYILFFNSSIYLINRSYIIHFKSIFDSQAKLIFLTENAEKEVKSEFPGIKQSYSNLFSFDEIYQFEQKINFEINKENLFILLLLRSSIISFILFRSFYMTKQLRFRKKEFNKYNLNNFIFVKNVGHSTNLYFNTKDQLLYILKHFDEISESRYNHEVEFYKKIRNKHPYISNFFGNFEYNGIKYVVIEYIEGQTLKKLIENKIKLTFIEKIKIIIEILISVEYIHLNGIILRDLKSDNFIIDSNHDLFLIDFDLTKIILNDSFEMTSDIGSNLFAAPEQLENNEYSYQVDLYSVGMLINYIICEKLILAEDFLKDIDNELPKFPSDYLFLTSIYSDLLEKSPEKRSNISLITTDILFCFWRCILFKTIVDDDYKIKKLISYFVNVRANCLEEFVNNKFDKVSSFADVSEIYCFLGSYYIDDEYTVKDIQKSLYYLNLSANMNNSRAQCNLGIFYNGFGSNNVFNIEKSLYYFGLSAENNNPKALYNLGMIYLQGVKVPKDTKKADYYFTLCGKIKDYFFLHFIGEQYYLDYKNFDINRAIHYYTLSSKLHNVNSQYTLGLIYYDNRYVPKDLNKAIHYFSLAANQNNAFAKLYIGKLDCTKGPLLDSALRFVENTKKSIQSMNSDMLLYIALQYYHGNINMVDIDKAIYYFKLSAQLNNSSSQFYLGAIYCDKNDINSAIYYLQHASNNNHSYAQYYLGTKYLEGNNFPHDINKGFYYLTLSSNNNGIFAHLKLGHEFLKGRYIKRDVNKAINYFNLAAKQNNQLAQNYLGTIYYEKNYIVQDIDKSIYYFTLSSNNNDPYGQYMLGTIYLREKKYIDINKAIHYLTLSANQNYSRAQYILGYEYLMDEKIPRNVDLSIHYLILSSKNNNSDANLLLGKIYYEGSLKPRDINKALNYFILSSNNNNEQAQYFVFLIYYSDIHLRDRKKAIHYLLLSSKNNHPSANTILGILYSKGKYFEKNINIAIHYYKEASNYGNNMAKNNLGVIYLKGIGDKKNISLAIEYFKEAIQLNNDILSIYNLARIYYFGIECEKNIPKSIQLLKKISNQMFLPTEIFLFLILNFDDKYKNPKEAQECRCSIFKRYFFDISLYYFFFNNWNDSFNVIKNCDLEYLMNEKHVQILISKILGSQNLFLTKVEEKSEDESENNIQRKNLTSDFYDGFGIKI